MALNQKKFEHKHEAILRDVRPLGTRIADGLSDSTYSAAIFMIAGVCIYIIPWALTFADLIMVVLLLYFIWLQSRDRSLAFKLPLSAKWKDANNGRGGKKGKAEGILFLGNTEKGNEQVWFTNSDIRTHILYLGTTGAGKTEGLKSLVTNAMAWGSGFVYVDGKADTDLWSSLSSLVRRFGRDDDLLVLNYMTGNADIQAPSNTMNPFSSGSASYLTNMLVSLMPESGGDNAMWKERAVSLVGSMMPILTWKRDNQEIPMSVRTIRDYLSLNNVIKLARDEIVPAEIRAGLKGYLDTLPGFIADAYDDEGKVKPPGPDTPQYNTETASQQHGYLAMQFTRSLQSLGDDYGYIFDTQAADVDMVDVVLNRRILVVLVPALEKSGDEVANLGKIVSASIKGMMGSALGSTVEGSSDTVIENKPTHSSTPFMTVFDEVGYYVAEGMAVMAAQARSLGFSLVFAGQDLPALKKRVREEANSITANCNIKLFGKLEDPTETKDFFEKTVGSAMVVEVSGFQMAGSGDLGSYHDTKQAGVQLRPRASYDGLRGFKEGQAVVTFGETVVDCAVFYSNPGFAKAMRVTRFMTLPPPDEAIIKHAGAVTKLRDLMVNKTWTAMRADVAVETPPEIAALGDGFTENNKDGVDPVDAGIAALVRVHGIDNDIPASTVPVEQTTGSTGSTGSSGGGPSAPTTAAPAPPPVTPAAAAPIIPQKPQTTTAPPAQSQAPAKPAIFGAKPATETPAAAPVQPAQQQQTPPPSAATQEQPAKPAIFGAAPKAEEPQSAQTTQPPAQPSEAPTVPTAPTTEQAAAQPTQQAPAKPAIFGAKPVSETSQPEPQQAQPEASAQPPATQETSPITPQAQQEQPAKPAIFGAAPKAEEQQSVPPAPVQPQPETPPQVPMEQPPAEQPTQTAPTASQEPVEQQHPSQAPAKPAIFGAKPATETPAAAPAQPPQQQQTPAPPATQEQPAKPTIFTTKPVEEPPAQPPQTQQSPQQPVDEDKKPAIFRKKPDDETSGDEN